MHPLKLLLLGAAAWIVTGCTGPDTKPDGRIHLSYWEKWSGSEEYAIQRVVDQFNQSQDRIFVDYLSVGDITRKTILATAGGDPPDIAGLYLNDMCSFADRDALTPLDGFIRDDGLTSGQFLGRYAKAYASMGQYHGTVWGLPSTPSTTAMYWNKDLFRQAGLDPEKPPQTIAELDAMADKLAQRDSSGYLTRVGFLPLSGYTWAFPAWFGGQIFDGTDITIGTNPANLTAFQWMTGYSTKYGVDTIRHFTNSFGLSLSSEDPFMDGQVAILFDGVWRSHYIRLFAPGLNYGVAPWPAAQPGVNDFTVAESDMLVIPRGAKHPREAWEFLRYISSPNLNAQREEDLSGVELLSFLQEKPSPLQHWSPYFTAHNPDRDLPVFRRLAESPHVYVQPRMGIWDEYSREIDTAFDESRYELETPEQALRECQARVERSWKWHLESLALRHQSTTATNP
jgi:ABC-type glycerol-3-phosphate transport system substrate-binding protein